MKTSSLLLVLGILLTSGVQARADPPEVPASFAAAESARRKANEVSVKLIQVKTKAANAKATAAKLKEEAEKALAAAKEAEGEVVLLDEEVTTTQAALVKAEQEAIKAEDLVRAEIKELEEKAAAARAALKSLKEQVPPTVKTDDPPKKESQPLSLPPVRATPVGPPEVRPILDKTSTEAKPQQEPKSEEEDKPKKIQPKKVEPTALVFTKKNDQTPEKTGKTEVEESPSTEAKAKATLIVTFADPNDRVFINKNEMKTIGLTRTFTTPEIPTDRVQFYEFQVIPASGAPTFTRRVGIKGGQTVTQNLTN